MFIAANFNYQHQILTISASWRTSSMDAALFQVTGVSPFAFKKAP
jgi:hypothetical protein